MNGVVASLTMAKDEVDDVLPDKDAAKGFYAKYEPKEILGRYVIRSDRIKMIRFLITIINYSTREELPPSLIPD